MLVSVIILIELWSKKDEFNSFPIKLTHLESRVSTAAYGQIRQFNIMLKARFPILTLFMEADTNLGPKNFSGQHLKKNGNLVVLFAAEWCPFCRRFSPIFKSALAEKRIPGALADLSDLDNPLWEIFDIQVIPTVIAFKEGDLIYRKDGLLGQGLPDNAMNEVVAYFQAGHKIAH